MKIGAKRTGRQTSITPEASVSKSSRKPNPGQEWESKQMAGVGQHHHVRRWISPVRKIQFRRWKQACEFEDLRKRFGDDEIKAWTEYREMKRGVPTHVVSPEQYDVETHLNRPTKETAGSERGKQQISNPLPRSGQTTGRFRKPMLVDQKWASSLVGLRLKVPAHWWNNCSGNTLYAGQIADINFSDDAKRYFMLKLDTEETLRLHPMRYDAVLRYADKEHPTHLRFNLPEKPPADPNLTRSCKRKHGKELGQAVSKAKKQKTNHEAAKKLPIVGNKSKGKNILSKDKDPNPSYFRDSPFKTSSQLTLHDGLNCSNIKISRLKKTKRTSFFEEQFKGRILLVESSLNDQSVPETTVTYVSENSLYRLENGDLSHGRFLFFNALQYLVAWQEILSGLCKIERQQKGWAYAICAREKRRTDVHSDGRPSEGA
jgi:hypothetical protein